MTFLKKKLNPILEKHYQVVKLITVKIFIFLNLINVWAQPTSEHNHCNFNFIFIVARSNPNKTMFNTFWFYVIYDNIQCSIKIGYPNIVMFKTSNILIIIYDFLISLSIPNSFTNIWTRIWNTQFSWQYIYILLYKMAEITRWNVYRIKPDIYTIFVTGCDDIGDTCCTAGPPTFSPKCLRLCTVGVQKRITMFIVCARDKNRTPYSKNLLKKKKTILCAHLMHIYNLEKKTDSSSDGCDDDRNTVGT